MQISRRQGFTLVEILAGLAVIAIMALILVPVINSTLTTSRLTQTTANMRQIGQAMLLFAGDNNGHLSTHSGAQDPEKRKNVYMPWTHMVVAYSGGSPIGVDRIEGGDADLRCPQGAQLPNPYHAPSWDNYGFESLRYTYVYNNQWYNISGSWPRAVPRPLHTIEEPQETILLYNAWVRGFSDRTPLVTPDTYESGRPVLFADGHVDVKEEWVEGIPREALRRGLPGND